MESSRVVTSIAEVSYKSLNGEMDTIKSNSISLILLCYKSYTKKVNINGCLCIPNQLSYCKIINVQPIASAHIFIDSYCRYFVDVTTIYRVYYKANGLNIIRSICYSESKLFQLLGPKDILNIYAEINDFSYTLSRNSNNCVLNIKGNAAVTINYKC